MRSRPLALAIRRVLEPHRRRRDVRHGSLVSDVGPEPCRLRPAVAGREHRYGRASPWSLSAETTRRSSAVASGSSSAATPPTMPASVELELDAVACVDLALPVERQVIGELADHHVGDRSTRRSGLGDRPALRAGVLRPHVADHLEARRNNLEHFGHVLAEQAKDAVAADTSTALGVLGRVHEGLARQVIRQRLRTGRLCAGSLDAAASECSGRACSAARSSCCRTATTMGYLLGGCTEHAAREASQSVTPYAVRRHRDRRQPPGPCRFRQAALASGSIVKASRRCRAAACPRSQSLSFFIFETAKGGRDTEVRDFPFFHGSCTARRDYCA